MILNRTVAPASQPVSISDLKRDLRYTEDDQDVYMLSLIQDATDYIDGPRGALGRAIVSQTWEMKLPCFWPVIGLYPPPVQSVVSI